MVEQTMATQSARYCAFISYRHVEPDITVAKALHKQIETYRVPKDIRSSTGRQSMGRVFRDQDELPLMADLGEGIRYALYNSDWLIVICSPDLPLSKWCLAEIDYFISLGRRDRILTVLTRGEPAQSFPTQLRYLPQADGTWLEREPLAADIRAGSTRAMLHKLQGEKLRLLAPMLGVDYDALRQRAKARRMRAALTASCAAAAFLALFGGFAIFQAVQINKQRVLATQNEMQLLAGRSAIAVAEEDRLGALQYAMQALQRHDALYDEQSPYLAEILQAMEGAAYTRSFQQIANIQNNNMRLWNLRFSPDDQRILGIYNQNSAAVLSAAGNEILFTVNNNIEALSRAEFSPDGRHFLTACFWEGSVTVWDSATGEMAGSWRKDTGSALALHEAAFLNNTTLLLQLPNETDTSQGQLLAWDFATDSSRVIAEGDALGGTLLTGASALSPDGHYIAVGNELGGPVHLIAGQDGSSRALDSDDRGYWFFAFSPDSCYLAGISMHVVTLWEVESGRIVASFEDPDGFAAGYDGAPVFSPDGKLLALGNSDGVLVLDAAHLTERYRLGHGHTDTLYTALFSPDGSLVAGISHGISICDAQSGSLLSTMEGADIVAAAFSHNGARLLASGYEGDNALFATPQSASITIQDSWRGNLVRHERWNNAANGSNLVSAHQADPGYVAAQKALYADPSGRYIAMTHPDGFIEVWDSQSEQSTPSFGIAEHWQPVQDLLMLDQLLVSASDEGRVLLADLATGQVLHALALGKPIARVELNADGGLLIVLPYDATQAYVYSTASGRLLFRMDAEPSTAFTDIGFAQDSSAAVAVQANGHAVVGQLYHNREALAAQAQAMLDAE